MYEFMVSFIQLFPVQNIGKIKVNLSLCLTKYHTMELYPLLN